MYFPGLTIGSRRNTKISIESNKKHLQRSWLFLKICDITMQVLVSQYAYIKLVGVHFYHTVYHLLPSLCGPSFCQDWYEMFTKGYKISLKYCSKGKQCGWPIMCGLYYILHRVIRSKTEERSHVEFTIPNNSKTFNYYDYTD